LKPRTAAGRAALASVEVSPAGREAVQLCSRMLDQLDRKLAPIDRVLQVSARRQPGCRALIGQLYGVGAVTATAILAEPGDARRFKSSDDAVRHSGLDLTVWQSDRKRAAGHLSHQAPSVLGWALFEAAQCAARHSSPDHAHYLQIAERIDHNRACPPVVRKLCRRAHHTLRELGNDALAPTNAPPTTRLVDAAA
jgi:transposase